MESTVKAYGKVLVFGAYSILEPGNLGLVLTIDRGTTTTVQETGSGKIVVDLKNFKLEIKGVMKDGKLFFNEEPREFEFIRNAVQYAFMYLNAKKVKVKDLRIMTTNDPQLYIKKQLKGGFGTSATATVSTVAAILHMHGIHDVDLVYRIARYTHFISQGKTGSGYDVAAACYGSHYFVSGPTPDTDFLTYVQSEEGLMKQEYDLPMFEKVILFSGKSASTQELVGKVLQYKHDHPDEYFAHISENNRINVQLKNALDQNNQDQIKELLETSWRMRKELGEKAGVRIEPRGVAKLIEHLKKNGAFTAGLAGAGGGDSILALCTSKDSKKQLANYAEKNGLAIMDLDVRSKQFEVVHR